jgi:hypothetical protein
MRDNYAGDVGDFGKYVLLRELMNQSDKTTRLGINWYYTDHEEAPNRDGRHVAYLDISVRDNLRYGSCCPELYDKLAMIIRQNKRRVAEVESSGILPRGTIYYSTPIPNSGMNPAERIQLRQSWFQQSLKTLENADIIFLDPDNGISLDISVKGKPFGMKYVFMDEIEAYNRSGKSLIVYNHRDRRPRDEYEMKILSIRQYVNSHTDIKVLRFKRVAVRDFIFLIQEHHRELMDLTIERLTNPPLDFLFKPFMEKKNL